MSEAERRAQAELLVSLWAGPCEWAGHGEKPEPQKCPTCTLHACQEWMRGWLAKEEA
jgi:hypothetical protein